MNLGRENGDGQGGQTFVEVHSSRPLYFGGPDTARILRLKLRTARVPGPEGGPGPEEGVRGRRRPARRAVRPAHPERGGAGARRSRRRRRGRSRLQEPLETESPAAAAGGAHRQIYSTTSNLKTVGHRKSFWFQVKTIPDNVEQNSKHQQHRPGKENCAAVENGSLH